MAKDMQSRIQAMFVRDRLWASGFVVVLWLVVLFVLLNVAPYIENKLITVVCWIAAIVLVAFNTASITAMIRHYAEDKEHIYSIDIRHLDAGR